MIERTYKVTSAEYVTRYSGTALRFLMQDSENKPCRATVRPADVADSHTEGNRLIVTMEGVRVTFVMSDPGEALKYCLFLTGQAEEGARRIAKKAYEAEASMRVRQFEYSPEGNLLVLMEDGKLYQRRWDAAARNHRGQFIWEPVEINLEV